MFITADDPGSPDRLRIENLQSELKSVTVLIMEDPGVTSARYSIVGRVRHERVQGHGYLEMWSEFPDGSAYFSRTLARSGPAQSLQGASGWRQFVLAFNSREGFYPSHLTLNVVLPGPGVVDLGPIRLEQRAAQDGPASSAIWWSGTTAGLVGGIAGTILGCLGALIGVLASRGKARQLVLSIMIAEIVFGAVCLVLGIIAVALSQPYAVYYPLLLIGVLCVAINAPLLPKLRARYEGIELRKMNALDAS